MPLRSVSFPATANRKNMFSNSASVRPPSIIADMTDSP